MTISRFVLQSQQVGFLTPVVGYMHDLKILKEHCRRHFFLEGREDAHVRSEKRREVSLIRKT